MLNRREWLDAVKGYQKNAKSPQEIEAFHTLSTLLSTHVDENNTLINPGVFFNSLNLPLGIILAKYDSTHPVALTIMVLQHDIHRALLSKAGISAEDVTEVKIIHNSLRKRALQNTAFNQIDERGSDLRKDLSRSRHFLLMKLYVEIRLQIANENKGKGFSELTEFIETIRKEAIKKNDPNFIEDVNSLIEIYNQANQAQDVNRWFFQSSKPIDKIVAPGNKLAPRPGDNNSDL